MKLKVKVLQLATKGTLVGILNEKDIQGLGIKPLDRVEIKDKNKKIIISVHLSLLQMKDPHPVITECAYFS